MDVYQYGKPTCSASPIKTRFEQTGCITMEPLKAKESSQTGHKLVESPLRKIDTEITGFTALPSSP